MVCITQRQRPRQLMHAEHLGVCKLSDMLLNSCRGRQGQMEGLQEGKAEKKTEEPKTSFFTSAINQLPTKRPTPTLEKSTISQHSFLHCTLFFSRSNDAEFGLAGGHADSKE